MDNISELKKKYNDYKGNIDNDSIKCDNYVSDTIGGDENMAYNNLYRNESKKPIQRENLFKQMDRFVKEEIDMEENNIWWSKYEY